MPTTPYPTLVIFSHDVRGSDEWLMEEMERMKEVRENGFTKEIVLLISGFDDDPRELADIPEVQAYCRRLVKTGLISYLSFTTSLPGAPKGLAGSLGSFEAWLLSIGVKDEVSRKQFDTFCDDILPASNAEADRRVGAIKFNPEGK
jgi:hypothetical protein